MPKKFRSFRNSTDGTNAELLLYGDIAGEKSWFGDEVTPKEFAEELDGLGDVSEIAVRINSGGGDVFAAQAIGNMLERNAAHVTAYIDGVCASAATIVACHCDRVIAANDSTYMIHPVKMGLYGYMDAETLKQYVDALDTIRENIVTLYAKKTCREKDELAGWMDMTSWWTGPQAKENGFVDELTDNGEDAAYENRSGILFVNNISMNLPFAEAPEFVQESLTAGTDGLPVNKKPAGQPEQIKEAQNMEIKTVDDLRKAFPALVDQIEQAVRAEAEKTAAENAANTERTRIRDIEEMTLPGSEALAAEAKFTNPMSAEDFARELVKNAKTQGASYLAQMQKDAQNSGVNGVTNAPPADKTNGDESINAIRGTNK